MSIIVGEYFAVNEISSTAKYVLYTIIMGEYFAVKEIDQLRSISPILGVHRHGMKKIIWNPFSE